MPSTWDPDQYHRFRDERSRPFFDLLDLVEPCPPRTSHGRHGKVPMSARAIATRELIRRRET